VTVTVRVTSHPGRRSMLPAGGRRCRAAAAATVTGPVAVRFSLRPGPLTGRLTGMPLGLRPSSWPGPPTLRVSESARSPAPNLLPKYAARPGRPGSGSSIRMPA
jgi:hypothetical protein